jgi:hypothetical protein
MLKVFDDASSKFAGVSPSHHIKTLENTEKPASPETFVGRDTTQIPRVPLMLPATADPKMFETELNRTRHTYEKTFTTLNNLVFENWGFQVKQKEVHTGWVLKKLY